MARRRIAEDPISRLAVWARRLALFALVTAILGTLIVRTGFLEIEPALATVACALLLAVIAILFALGALAMIWKDGLAGTGSALGAIVLGIGLIAYPGYLASKAWHLPMINRIPPIPMTRLSWRRWRGCDRGAAPIPWIIQAPQRLSCSTPPSPMSNLCCSRCRRRSPTRSSMGLSPSANG